jgi:hypothetical protein
VWLIGTLAGVLPASPARVTVLEATGPAAVRWPQGTRRVAQPGGDPGRDPVDGRGAGRRGRDDPRCTALAIRSDDRLAIIVANLGGRPRSGSTCRAERGSVPDRIELEAFGHHVIDIRVRPA